jgi:hypothetical protein
MIKYPKIRQFRDAIKEARHKGLGNSLIPYVGRVKLHGTNAAISFGPGGVHCQSRNRVITPDDDNLGFATWVSEMSEDTIQAISEIARARLCITEPSSRVVIYGEWCGGNIQDNVGIKHMERKFVVFGVRTVKNPSEEDQSSTWDNDNIHFNYRAVLNEAGVYHISQFSTFRLLVDFQKPGVSQNFIANVTQMVEDNCPVAESMASVPEGEDNTGEGLVWQPIDPRWKDNSDLWFKSKGVKHSKSKVKTIAPVNLELAKSIDDFIDATVTRARLYQGIEYLNEMNLEVSRSSTGAFLKWVGGDILEEEKDMLEASAFERKDVGKHISMRARGWFFEYLDWVDFHKSVATA